MNNAVCKKFQKRLVKEQGKMTTEGQGRKFSKKEKENPDKKVRQLLFKQKEALKLLFSPPRFPIAIVRRNGDLEFPEKCCWRKEKNKRGKKRGLLTNCICGGIFDAAEADCGKTGCANIKSQYFFEFLKEKRYSLYRFF